MSATNTVLDKRTGVMDNHNIREPKKVIESENTVEDGGGMTAHIPHNHSLWLQLANENHSSASRLIRRKSTYQRV